MLCVCVNYKQARRDLLYKADTERQIYAKLFIAILFTLIVFAINLLIGSRRRDISLYFVLLKTSDLGFELWAHI